MNKIKLLICKLVYYILKIFNRGSNLPGVLYLKLKGDLTYFKMPKVVVAVTGSAGKGSTSSLISDTLKCSGMSVSHNKFGSNMLPGILSLLIISSKLNGSINSDSLVVEVDERYTKKVFDIIKPNYVVITNITRDQPPRHGDVSLVFDKIYEALTPSMHLILNGDDPYLRKFNLDDKFDVTYYGIDENKLSYKENTFHNINMYYCPLCGKKLKYNYYHFEALGDYHCSCKFKRDNITYLANKIDLDNNYMTINDTKVNISFSVLYYAYNILSAFTVCKLIGLSSDDIALFISNIENNKKLNDHFKYNNKDIYIMNNKAENSTTYNESVFFTEKSKGKKIIVVGWKEISRRYEFNDMSWLYDISFEHLNNKDVKSVLCVGRDKYDIALRMKYAGFPNEKILVYDSLDDAKDYILNSKSDVYAILNFDYIKPFNDLFKER